MKKTSNNQRLRECGRQRSAVQTLLLQHCALRKFLVSDGQNKTRVIRLRGVEGRNARDQIAFFRSAKSKRHTCDTCVMTTWRLGLWAPLVARTKS